MSLRLTHRPTRKPRNALSPSTEWSAKGLTRRTPAATLTMDGEIQLKSFGHEGVSKISIRISTATHMDHFITKAVFGACNPWTLRASQAFLTFNVFSSSYLRLLNSAAPISRATNAGKVRWRFAAHPTSARGNICPSLSPPLCGGAAASPPIVAACIEQAGERGEEGTDS